MTKGPRLVVVGLDCAPPALVFDRYRSAMPTVSRIAGRGIWGELRSTTPPITVPAWCSMTSGRDPGELGLYGFRNRASRDRTLTTSTSNDVHVPRLWDLAEDAGKHAVTLYVPPTYPPPETKATIVSCMLTPGPDSPHTSPASLAAELARFGPHQPDLDDDGSLDDDALLDGLFAMAKQHFDVAEHLLRSEAPDFLMLVELATDRLHHALWPAMDPSDPRHDPRSPRVRQARDVYAYLDTRIGRLMQEAGDDAHVMVVSDHGARPLLGGVYVNEVLRRAGYLALKREPASAGALDPNDVDWSRTRAWSEGGYYARVFLNVEGREHEGAVLRSEIERTTRELAALFARLEESGRVLESRVVLPAEAYREVRGVAPDLLVFFGDLSHRSLAAVGTPSIFATIDDVERDRGRGGCNHDWNGIVTLAGPSVTKRGRITDASILDIAPTCLGILGVAPPPELRGRDLRTLHPR